MGIGSADHEVTSRLTLEGNPENLLGAMEKSVTSIKQGATDITGSLTGMVNQVGGSVNGLIGVFGTLGTIAGGMAFKSIVSQAATWNGESAKLAKTLGETTESASILKVQLQHLSIDQDLVSIAALRMAKTMGSNSEAFKELHVDVEGMQKQGKGTIEILMSTVKALGEYKGGMDRNEMAMTIFGRSWGELQSLMKLNEEGFRKAEERARQLHLIVGPEGVAKTREYKEGLNDLDLLGQSLAINIGNLLIPELANLGSSLNQTLPTAVGGLITHLHDVQAEMIRMAMLVDKAGGSLTTLGYIASKTGYVGAKFITIGQFGDSMDNAATFFDRQNKLYEQRYKDGEKELQKLANLEVGLDENGNPIKPTAAPHGGGKRVDHSGEADDSATRRTNEYIGAYNKLQEERLKGAIQGNATLSDTEKKLAEVALRYKDLLALYPEHRAELQRNQALDEQQIKNLAALKEAEDARLKSDAYVNAQGQMGTVPDAAKYGKSVLTGNAHSQTSALDESAMLSTWAAAREKARQEDLQKSAEFFRMTQNAGDTELEQSLARIETEKQAYLQSWAGMTDSFEEEARRRGVIEAYFAQKSAEERKKHEYDVFNKTVGYAKNGLSATGDFLTGLNTLTKGKSKELQTAMKAVNIGMAIANTALGVTKALAENPWPYSAVVAGIVAAAGATQIGIIASSDSSSGSAPSFSGGSSSGSSFTPASSGYVGNSPIVTQPISQQVIPAPIFNINITGAIGSDKWFDDNMPPIMKDWATRNVGTGFVPS